METSRLAIAFRDRTGEELVVRYYVGRHPYKKAAQLATLMATMIRSGPDAYTSISEWEGRMRELHPRAWRNEHAPVRNSIDAIVQQESAAFSNTFVIIIDVYDIQNPSMIFRASNVSVRYSNVRNYALETDRTKYVDITTSVDDFVFMTTKFTSWRYLTDEYQRQAYVTDDGTSPVDWSDMERTEKLIELNVVSGRPTERNPWGPRRAEQRPASPHHRGEEPSGAHPSSRNATTVSALRERRVPLRRSLSAHQPYDQRTTGTRRGRRDLSSRIMQSHSNTAPRRSDEPPLPDPIDCPRRKEGLRGRPFRKDEEWTFPLKEYRCKLCKKGRRKVIGLHVPPSDPDSYACPKCTGHIKYICLKCNHCGVTTGLSELEEEDLAAD